jgi:hypothetical protein
MCAVKEAFERRAARFGTECAGQRRQRLVRRTPFSRGDGSKVNPAARRLLPVGRALPLKLNVGHCPEPTQRQGKRERPPDATSS